MKRPFITDRSLEIQQGLWFCSAIHRTGIQFLEYGLLAIVVAGGVLTGGKIDAGLVAVLSLLFAGMYLFPVRFRERVFLDFGSVAIVAALFASGVRTAIVTAAAGPSWLFLLEAIFLRIHHRPLRSPARVLANRLRLCIANYGVAIAAGALILWLSGQTVPLDGVHAETLVPVALTLVGYLVALYAVMLLRLRAARSEADFTLSRTGVVYAIVLCLTILPAGVVIAAAYTEFGWSTLFLLTLAGVLVGSWGSQVAVDIHISLRQRINQLATLNRIGQALTANLSVDRLLETLYEQLAMSCNMTGFVVALVDADSGLTSFPFLTHNGIRQMHPPDAMTESLLNTIIADKEPLLRSGRPECPGDWQSDNDDESPRRTGSFLGVPLLIDGDVVGVIALQHDTLDSAYGSYERDLLTTAATHVTIALRNARLFQFSETVQFDLYKLVESSRLFNASLDLDTVAVTVTERLLDATPFGSAALYSGQRDAHSLDLLACRPEASTVTANALPMKLAEPINRALVTRVRDPLCIDRADGENSVAIVPLFVESETVGLAVLWASESVTLEKRDQQLLQGIVNQAAAAVHNALTHRHTDVTLRERLVELSAIEIISRRMSASLEVDQVIDDVLAAAMSTIDAQSGTFLLPGDRGGYVAVSRLADEDVKWETPSTHASWMDAADQAMREFKPLRVSDMMQGAQVDATLIRSALFVPVMRGSGPLGLFVFEDARPDVFTESHARFVRMLAEHGAVAIENARLFSERRRQIELLIALRGLSLRLLSAKGLDDVAHAIVHTAQVISQAPAENIKLYLRKSCEAPLVMVLPEASGEMPNETVRQVADSGETYYAVEPHPPWMDTVQLPQQVEDITVCLPIQRGGENQGVLEVIFSADHRYTPEETQALALLANQAAVAVDNMRLNDTIRSGRDRLQAILDSTREGILLFDRRGRLQHYNSEAERMLSCSLTDRLGQSVYSWLRTGDHLTWVDNTGFAPDALRNYIRSVVADPLHTTHRQFEQVQDGESRILDEIGLPVRAQNGRVTGWLLVWRDITEAHRFESLREDLTNMIVHDLRAPLSSIINSLNIVQEMVNLDVLDPDEATSMLGMAVQSAESMLRMVQSLLDIARLEQAHVDLEREPCSLAVAVDAACASVLPQLTAAGVLLEINVADDLPQVLIDQDQIQRILINLLDNAVRFTPDGGTVRVTAFSAEDRATLTVAIIDDGPGIPADARSRVFDKFSQLEGPMRPGHRGMGLGLAFCKLAVEAHGGVIWVDDAPAGGAAFHFTLPVANGNT